MRAIAIDDDKIFLTVLQSLLHMVGVRDVSTFSVGQDAMAHLAIAPDAYEFAFIDLNMPDMDGFALLRSLAEMGFKGGVVVISGERQALRQSAGHICDKLGLKFLGSLAKPPRLEDVRNLVDSLSSVEPRPADIGPPMTVRSKGFQLHYQPQIDAVSGKIVGCEALLRVVGEDDSIHGPQHFFRKLNDPAARFELTSELYAILMTDMRKMKEQGVNIPVGFNMDATVFEADELVPMLLHYAKYNGIERNMIKIELTESHLPSDASRLLEVIARLSMQGFRLSLDDFGTGTSNFSLLYEAAFDEVKVDKNITRAATKEPEVRKFLKSMVEIAGAMTMNVVAEGIETKDDFDAIAELGVNTMQGYFFSPAVNCDKFIALVQAQNTGDRRANA